jgi:benzaldehyde dehydrogenase (NAD)
MTQQPTVSLLPRDLLNGVLFTGIWKTSLPVKNVVSPSTGEVLGAIALGSSRDIDDAASTAQQAQRKWAAQNYDDRARVLRQAVTVAEHHADEIVGWLIRESGSTPDKARFELSITIKAILEAAAMPSQPSGLTLPTEAGRLNLARRRPIGVVGVISPFNFPLYLAMRAVAPAIAVGNSVILKPDTRTAICGGVVLARIFEEAGLPVGVLSMIPGDADAGAALCEASQVGMIQFTGSTAAGKKVGEVAGRNLKKVSLELGGKNALIVLDDADLDLAVKTAVWSTYLHQGQICMSAGRILLQASIAEEFTRRLTENASRLTVGDPGRGGVAIGPLISLGQIEHASSIISASCAAGATVLTGGISNGLYLEPTVLTDVTRENPAFSSEIFAPVAVLATFETDEDAITLANDTDYGLSAAIISQSVGRALALGDRLDVGLLHINDATVNDEVINPFGGVGKSGNRSSIGGPANWEEFTQWQWVTVRSEPPAYPL